MHVRKDRKLRVSRTIAISLIITALVAVAALAGCAKSGPGEDHPAAKAIQKLLELRREDSRDTKAYTPFFKGSEIASALAHGSTQATGTPEVPLWQPPYVTAETSQTADVAVVWKKDAKFPKWPKVNIFRLQRSSGSWVVIDAIEATSVPKPIASGK